MLIDLMAAQNCQDERRQEVIATVERGRLKRGVGLDRSGNVRQRSQAMTGHSLFSWRRRQSGHGQPGSSAPGAAAREMKA
jgi:hypothetical protein